MGFAKASTHPTFLPDGLFDLPDGQITWAIYRPPVSSPFCKNILIFRRPKSVYIPSRPVPQRGARAIVTNAGRDAVDADSAVRRPALEEDGEVVWS